MDLLVFLIVFLFFTALTLALNHYRALFSQNREEYKKTELIDIKTILETQWKAMFQKGDATQAYLDFGIAAFAGFLFSFMGGLYNLHYESYFFHSAALPAAIFFLIPYLKDHVFVNGDGANAFIQKMLNDEPILVFGFGISTAAQTLSVYGLYHAISFLWVLANCVVILGLVLYRFANPHEGALRASGAGKKK